MEPIEPRLFAVMTRNGRGKPLLTHQVIIQLIANCGGAGRLDRFREEQAKGLRQINSIDFLIFSV